MPLPIDAAERHVARLERLLAVGRTLTAELDLSTMLDRLLVAARDLTDARYAALGVLDAERKGLAEFFSLGLDDPTPDATGEPPRGGGLIGLPIDHPSPARLRELLQHPRGQGPPPGDPAVQSFVGAPIVVRGEVWGTIYLTEKVTADDFDEHDLDSIVTLAEWAAIAIHNARLFAESARGRAEVERTMRTTIEIAEAIGSDTDLPPILELIAARARELVDADGLVIWLRHGEHLRVAAVAGVDTVRPDAVIALDGSTAGAALRSGRPVRVSDARSLLSDPSGYGMGRATSALVVPLSLRGEGLGALTAFDRRGATASFGADDERALVAFAATAATAVATARLVERQRLQDTMWAAEAERTRWARELHDETLQGLASLKILLAAALRAPPGAGRPAAEAAVEQVEDEIAALRAIIADLRPAALDELGLEPALRTLVARVTDGTSLRGRVRIDLGGARLSPTLETVAYRVAQEALRNVEKHARAHSVALEVGRESGRLWLRVTDDGRGVAPDPPARRGATDTFASDDRVHPGYGITGMRERAALAGGTLVVAPGPDRGTVVSLELPVR